MPDSEPLISFIATSRNDDHGGSLLRRMQIFVTGLIEQCKRHNLNAELILVEWNPPSERQRFAQALKWPSDTGPCRVRIIGVPPELHSRFKHSESLPLFQMIAKNIGIRRARGKFLLATNIDILFNDELMCWMASGAMQPGRMYRIDRYDAMAEVPLEAGIGEQLEYCRTHLVRLNPLEGSYAVLPDGRRTVSLPERALSKAHRMALKAAKILTGKREDIIGRHCGMRLGFGWYPAEKANEHFSRRVYNNANIVVSAPPGQLCPLALEIEPEHAIKLRVLDDVNKLVREFSIERRSTIEISLPLQPGQTRVFTLNVSGGGAAQTGKDGASFRVFHCGWAKNSLPQTGFRIAARRLGTFSSKRVWLHTNACGDFTLMAREHWLDLRGYAEFEMFSFNIDSLFCYCAHAAGVREEILRDPTRIYHIEHGTGSGWTPEGERQLYERIAAKGIPCLEYETVVSWSEEMNENKAPKQFNAANWGLASEELPETILGTQA